MRCTLHNKRVRIMPSVPGSSRNEGCVRLQIPDWLAANQLFLMPTPFLRRFGALSGMTTLSAISLAGLELFSSSTPGYLNSSTMFAAERRKAQVYNNFTSPKPVVNKSHLSISCRASVQKIVGKPTKLSHLSGPFICCFTLRRKRTQYSID
jgi:hypothetical protein